MYRLKNVSYKDPRGNSYGEYRGNKQSKLIQQNAEGLVD